MREQRHHGSPRQATPLHSHFLFLHLGRIMKLWEYTGVYVSHCHAASTFPLPFCLLHFHLTLFHHLHLFFPGGFVKLRFTESGFRRGEEGQMAGGRRVGVEGEAEESAGRAQLPINVTHGRADRAVSPLALTVKIYKTLHLQRNTTT
ncbi:hypothetical protein E2C01_001348 [Portunus trituberculatus]|uniref:Uncharacterized protein n=1 Tax=Portunus trituberculatus TaxID=210409 RepID=A0A5B7CJ62_PORTR|nr:hypothetical protein [Portunus trituberculatus]